jgi:hypothetical protein
MNYKALIMELFVTKNWREFRWNFARTNLKFCLSFACKIGKTKENLSQDGPSPEQDLKPAAFNVKITYMRINKRHKRATLN